MSDAEDDDEGLPHPRMTYGLEGHGEAEAQLLEAYRTGRLPHAIILGGPESIGKATFAYRLARFILAHPDPSSRAVREATSLAVPETHPTARRIEAMGHPDLLVLDRSVDPDTGKVPTEIAVKRVRRATAFFSTTAGEGGWRVAIVDAAEDLNTASANALLKILEEPPPRGLFLVVAHQPGRVLPTIRSRCRKLMLKPPEPEAVARVLERLTDTGDAEARLAAAHAADGQIARALQLLTGGLDIRHAVEAMLARLPALDPLALHGLADQVARGRTDAVIALRESIERHLSARLAAERSAPVRRLARFAEVWDKTVTSGRTIEAYNLDARPFVFAVFAELAELAKPAPASA